MNERPQNPYRVGLPIHDKGYFFGREELIKSIQTELLNPSTKVLVLYGQRRIGKTSIQIQLSKELSKTSYLPVYFDLQDWAEHPLGQLLFDLARQTADSIDTTLDIGKPVNYDDSGKYFQLNFIPKIKAILGEKRKPVFLFDEFDALDNARHLSGGLAGKTLFSFIKKLIDETNDLIFIFVVGRHAEDLPEKYKSIFKVSHIKEVWTLDKFGAEELIRQAENNGTLLFTPGGFEKILALANGHPYMTQLLCQRVWELAYQNWEFGASIPTVDEILVDKAVEDSFKAGEAAFVWLWDGLSNEEKIFAAAFAQNSLPYDELKPDVVLRILRENSPLLQIMNREGSAEKLVKRHILRKNAQSLYRFEIELFRLWIKQNRPLDIVKKILDQSNPEAEELYQTAKKLFEKNQIGQAIDILQKTMSINPQHFGAQLLLSEGFLNLGDINRAYQEAQKAYALDSVDAKDVFLRILQVKGQMEYEKRQTKQALRTSQLIIEIEPDNVYAKKLSANIEKFRRENVSRLISTIFILIILAGIPGFLLLYKYTDNILTSLSLTLLYEILVTTGSFVAQVWQKIESRWVNLASDWLDITFQTLFTGYRRRYLEYLVYQHRSFDVKGLSTQGPYSLNLDTVFVQLSIEPTAAHEVSANPLKEPTSDLPGNHYIWEFIQERKLHHRNYVILGAPGSGKTTLLKHMALSLAGTRNFRQTTGVPNLLPVLLFLRDHAQSIKENPATPLAQLIREQFERRQAPLPPQGWLERQIERGNCLIMFDGLDEIAEPSARRIVVSWIEESLSAYGNNQFVITSRPFGYRTNPLSGVTVLQVQPFSSQQVEQFVGNWYLANELMSYQKDDPGVREDARRGATDLVSRLRSSQTLSALAVNPLLLTMIATVHRYRSSLPGRRVELYAEICEVFLGKRQAARGLILDLTPAQKNHVLSRLAYTMMRQELREIDIKDASSVIAKPLSSVAPHMREDDFLQNVENTSGLLVAIAPGRYSFSNLTFQEYLASVYIVNQRLEAELTTYIGSYWWHETILLYCALADASPVIAACLSSSDVAVLSLAIECMDEAREISPEIREKYASMIENGVEDPDPNKRRLIAAALLKRRIG